MRACGLGAGAVAVLLFRLSPALGRDASGRPVLACQFPDSLRCRLGCGAVVRVCVNGRLARNIRS